MTIFSNDKVYSLSLLVWNVKKRARVVHGRREAAPDQEKGVPGEAVKVDVRDVESAFVQDGHVPRLDAVAESGELCKFDLARDSHFFR